MWHEIALRVAVGCLLLVQGWQIYRFGIKVLGFYFGFLAGAVIWELVLALTEGKVDLPRSDAANLAAGVVLGIMGAYLSFRLYTSVLWVAVIGACLYLGYATPYFKPLYELIGWTGALPALQKRLGNLLPGAIALILALVALLLHRHIIIITTAGTGAHLVSSVTPYPILFFPLFLVGIAVQAGIRTRSRPKPAEAEESS
jgi:hypothetical protein